MSLIRYWLKSVVLILIKLFIPIVLIEIILDLTKINATSANTLPVTLSNQIIPHVPISSYRQALAARLIAAHPSLAAASTTEN